MFICKYLGDFLFLFFKNFFLNDHPMVLSSIFFFRSVILFCHYIRLFKLHSTFCEQLTHTVWCCTKALCTIFVLRFLLFARLSSELMSYTHSSCSTAMDRSYFLWPSGLIPRRPGCTATVAITKAFVGKMHRLSPGGPRDVDMGLAHDLCSYLWHVCGNMKTVLYSCHHIISRT